MHSQLSGRKGVFLWNWSSLGEEPERTVRDFLERSGCTFVLLKAWDGGEWFDQGPSWKTCAEFLRSAGCEVVGAWGYQLLTNPAAEALLASECVSYGLADLVVLNCEDPRIERMSRPDLAAVRFFDAYRELSPDVETWFCSHARPSFHARQPYWQALQAGCGMMPMAYHGAMQVAPEESIQKSLADYERFRLLDNGVSFAGDAYTTGTFEVTAGEIGRWAQSAMEGGSQGLSWWALDGLLVRPELVDAIESIQIAE